MTNGMPEASAQLAAIGQRFYARGWVMGTAGNFSTVLSREPLILAMTSSSVNKGTLTNEQIIEVDGRGMPLDEYRGKAQQSAECLLHIEIVRRRGAGSVLHTHSIWSTILSDHFASRGSIEIEGYELLKGLSGITSHESRELVPIIENDQDMTKLSARLGDVLAEYPAAHGVLLRRHGLYTWGDTPDVAERHIEVLEFLLEAVGRSLSLRQQETTYGTLENP